MRSFMVSVATLTVLVVLLVALLEHAVSPASLRRALVSQAVLPKVLAVPVAGVVMATETALVGSGGIGLLAGGSGRAAAIQLSLRGAAALFVLYAFYTWFLVARREGAPCGCWHRDAPVNRWVVVRALLLAALATTGVLFPQQPPSLAGSAARTGTVLAAALTFAVLLWHLPMALDDPVQAMLRAGRQQVRQLAGKESRA